MKGAIYSRVSTIIQDYERQTSELIEFAKINDIEIVKVFEEKESGFFNDRPQFKKLCMLTKDDIDIVLVYEFSRLSRSAIHLQKTIEDFTNKGINIYAKKERKYTLKSDGTIEPTTQLLIAFVSTFAQQEVATNKARSIASRDHRIIHKGESSRKRSMYGYIYNKETKKLVIEKKGAEMVRLIFDLAIKGLSYLSICKELDSLGYKPTRAKRWSFSSIRLILSNEIYAGSFFYKGYILPTTPIITQETFKKARKCIEQRKAIKVHDSQKECLLKKLIICPYCGHCYVHNAPLRTYLCSTKVRNDPRDRNKCPSYILNSNNIDFIIWEIITSVCVNQQLKASRITKYKQQIEKITTTIRLRKEKIAMLEKDKEKMVNAVLMLKYRHPATDEKMEQIINKLDVLDKQINECKFEVIDMESKIKSYNDEVHNIFSNEHSGHEGKLTITKSLIKKIVPYRNGSDCVIIVYFQSGEKYTIIYKRERGKRRYYMEYVWFSEKNVIYNNPYENNNISAFSIIPSNNEMFNKDEYGIHEYDSFIKIITQKGLFKKMRNEELIQ